MAMLNIEFTLFAYHNGFTQVELKFVQSQIA